MHHGTEMSSVSLLVRASSITPTLTVDEYKEGEEQVEGGRQRRNAKRIVGEDEVKQETENVFLILVWFVVKTEWWSPSAGLLLALRTKILNKLRLCL